MGSSSLITNLDGDIVQHIEYVSFGEVFIEERNNTWNTPYLFNAKELDEETGLYYYGARYYSARESVWLSTDPLQEKYPNISTYAYCAVNPVNYIDPDGREVINGFHKNDKINHNAAEKFKKEHDDANVIYVFGHGYEMSIDVVDKSGKTIEIKDGFDFVDFLEKNSSSYADLKEKGDLTVVLISCRAGGEMKYEGNQNIAQDVSSALNLESLAEGNEATIIAPSTTIITHKKIGLVGVYDYNTTDTGGYSIKEENMGQWNIYQDKKNIGSFEGNKLPTKKHIEETINNIN